jgi:chloride channel 7
MLTFTAARYAGYYFNAGLYETQLKLLQHPFLETDLPDMGLVNYDHVERVMAASVVTLRDVDSVKNVHQALVSTPHNGFPVVRNGRLCGIILRKTLCQLLKHRAFSSYASTEASASIDVGLQTDATVLYDSLEKDYPSFPRIEDIVVSDADKDKLMDLRQYMDTSPYTVDITASVEKSYRLFRTMGLRHIIVIDADHTVRGILTRKDITEEKLREKETFVSGYTH